MRSGPCAASTLLLLLSAAIALPDDPAPAPPPTVMTQEAYRAAAGRWHAIWTERPALSLRDEASCVAAWQTGDRVRTMVRAATPAPGQTAYHDALLSCIEASLAVSDECLLKPNGGPKWMPNLLAARKTCSALSGITRSQKLDLPPIW